MAKDENQRNMKKVPQPGYDMHDISFMEILKSVALNTTAYFTPSYTIDDISAKIAKENKIKIDSIPKDPQTQKSGEWAELFENAEAILAQEEEKLSFLKKNVKGDASETGLIKFVQPLFMKSLEGLDHDGLEGYRSKFPVVKNITGDQAMIPFTSDIKFNMMIRDLNASDSNPSTAKDNMAVFLKGAPERVLSRCTKILY